MASWNDGSGRKTLGFNFAPRQLGNAMGQLIRHPIIDPNAQTSQMGQLLNYFRTYGQAPQHHAGAHQPVQHAQQGGSGNPFRIAPPAPAPNPSNPYRQLPDGPNIPDSQNPVARAYAKQQLMNMVRSGALPAYLPAWDQDPTAAWRAISAMWASRQMTPAGPAAHQV